MNSGIELNDLLSSKPKKQIFLRFWVLFFVFVYLYEKHKRNPKIRAYFKSFKANPRAKLDELFPPLKYLVFSTKLANIPNTVITKVFRFFVKLKTFSVDSIDLDLLRDLVQELKYDSLLKPTPRFFKSINEFLESGDYNTLYDNLMHQLTRHPELKKEFSDILKILKRVHKGDKQKSVEPVNVPNSKKLESETKFVSKGEIDIKDAFMKLIAFKVDEKFWRSPFTQFLNFVITGASIRNIDVYDVNLPFGFQFDIWCKKFYDELVKFGIIQEGDISVESIKKEFRTIFSENYKKVYVRKSASDNLKNFIKSVIPYVVNEIDLSLFRSPEDIEHFAVYWLFSNPEKFEKEIFPKLKGSKIYREIQWKEKEVDKDSEHPVIEAALKYFLEKGLISYTKAKDITSKFLKKDSKSSRAESTSYERKIDNFLKVISRHDIYLSDVKDLLGSIKDNDAKEILKILDNGELLESLVVDSPDFVLTLIKKFIDTFGVENLFFKAFAIRKNEFVLDPFSFIDYGKNFSVFGKIFNVILKIISYNNLNLLKLVDPRYLFLELFSDNTNLINIRHIFVERFGEIVEIAEPIFDFSTAFENIKPVKKGSTIYIAFLVLRRFYKGDEKFSVFKKIKRFLEVCKVEKPSEGFFIRIKARLINYGDFSNLAFIVKSLVYEGGFKDIVNYGRVIYDRDKIIISKGISSVIHDRMDVLISDLNGIFESLSEEKIRELLNSKSFLDFVFKFADDLSDKSIEIVSNISKIVGAFLKYEKYKDSSAFDDITRSDIRNDLLNIKIALVEHVLGDGKKFVNFLKISNKEFQKEFMRFVFDTFRLEGIDPSECSIELKEVYNTDKEQFMKVIDSIIYLIKEIKNQKFKKDLRNVLKSSLNLISLDSVKDKLFDPKHSKELVPLIEPDDEFIFEALKFNQALPIRQIRIKDSFSEEDARKLIQKIENQKVILPEPKIEPLELNLKELAKETKYLSRFLSKDAKHGNIAPIVLKVWKADVIFPEFEKFKSKYPDTIMDPVFHGTGSFAAAFILRYGFRVVKGSLEKAGKMLGNGIYFTNVIDKALQYVGDTGFTRSYATKGYILQMEAVLGEENKHYRAAGLGTDQIKSPEWCVFNPKAQLRIYKVYLVQIVSRNSMMEFLEKYSVRG